MVQLINAKCSKVVARACRNSLLWYNGRSIPKQGESLGLVGIPCYGTIVIPSTGSGSRLGLVGIPCYGTIVLRG